MSGTATRRAPSAPVSDVAAPREVFAGFATGEETGSRSTSGRMRIGFIRQIAYVAIDVAMVCVGGVLVFWLNFDLQSVGGLAMGKESAGLKTNWR